MSEIRGNPRPGRLTLIGQYDSAFVRRVGIALRIWAMDFDHLPWSVFGDAGALMTLNPLGGVPVLVLETGTVLTDSATILHNLDARHHLPRLWPDDPAQESEARRLTALCTGLADRFVSLFYERRLHDAVSPVLTSRREAQVHATLSALETARAPTSDTWWFGDHISHADIALGCVLRHLRESLPELFDDARLPALARHAADCEATAVFQQISQPFVAPA